MGNPELNITYCPKCGQERLRPLQGGANEYDSRHKLLPFHKTPWDEKCPETTTPGDAKRFLKEWGQEGMMSDPSPWPALKMGKSEKR